MNDKTIRMPKELLAKWLAALRSGEYKQGAGLLYRDFDDSYCCLGVLQHTLTGAVETKADGTSESGPTHEWLAAHGIRFLSQFNYPSVSPWLPRMNNGAMGTNDSGVFTFAEIADAIEACAEGV